MIGVNRRRVMGGAADGIIMTSSSNPEVLAICYARGWCASPDYMTKAEAEAVTDIGVVFSNNESITHFDELQYFGVTSIPNRCFYFSHNLASVILPQAITIIGDSSFQRVYGITHIDFPSGIISLGSAAFFYMTSLVGADLSHTLLTSIGNQCFRGCTAITRALLPTTITSIGTSAFDQCLVLSELVVEAVTPPSLGETALRGVPGFIYVPDESVELYKTATTWSTYANRIKPISELQS